jgi:hypothetical protein
MSKGFESLSLQVKEVLRRDPLCEHLFCSRDAAIGWLPPAKLLTYGFRCLELGPDVQVLLRRVRLVRCGRSQGTRTTFQFHKGGAR